MMKGDASMTLSGIKPDNENTTDAHGVMVVKMLMKSET